MHLIRINHVEVKLTSTSLVVPSVAYKLNYYMEYVDKTQTNLLSTSTYTNREIILLAHIFRHKSEDSLPPKKLQLYEFYQLESWTP